MSFPLETYVDNLKIYFYGKVNLLLESLSNMLSARVSSFETCLDVDLALTFSGVLNNSLFPMEVLPMLEVMVKTEDDIPSRNQIDKLTWGP